MSSDQPQNLEPINPYANTTTHYAVPGALQSDDESIRRQYLSHETSLKSIRLLYYFSGGLSVFYAVCCVGAGFIIMFEQSKGGPGIPEIAITMVVAIVLLALGVGQILIGRGIKRLKDWARITIGAFAVVGLLGIPIGTLISAYILFLTFSQKGQFVCSPQYQQVIANTPHIKYKTPVIVWVLAGVLGAFIVAGILGVMLSSNA